MEEQSSNESLLNSHRRCKSQNVRGDPDSESYDKKKSSTGKKKSSKGDIVRTGSKQTCYNQDMPDEILLLNQGTSSKSRKAEKPDELVSFVSGGTLDGTMHRNDHSLNQALKRLQKQ
mmetsp:Transcript_26109/g.19642  ORF Transcript_26109/g.19642 Transcript_26109/m.19642 type:complete len:117 (+) Transcript_26109:533-883(+)